MMLLSWLMTCLWSNVCLTVCGETFFVAFQRFIDLFFRVHLELLSYIGHACNVGCSIFNCTFLWSNTFCGLVVLGETTAHYHFCAAVANVLTLADINPRQPILGMCCYTDSLTSRHFQLQSYISEWWRCCCNASLAWSVVKQGLCMYPFEQC